MAEEKSTTTLNKARVDELLGYIKQTFYSQAEHAQGIEDFNAWWLSVLGQPNGVPKTDANNKILQGFFPDYILGQLLWGGTIAGNDKISPSSHLSSKIDIVDESISSSNVAKYTGIYFIATADANTSGSIVNSLDVRTGDWVISTGVEWVKIDNTDAVRSVADYVGSITAEELRNRLISQYKDGNTYKNYALGTMHYADGSGRASQLATTAFARSILGGIASQNVFSGLYADKAQTLLNKRTIWGQEFDGSGNVSGAMSGVTNINSVLYLSSSGNVGIGNTSPTAKLHVNGTFNAQGATTLQSTLNVVGVATHNDHILLVNGKNIAGQLQDDKTNISLLGISNTDTVLVGYGAVGKYNTNIYGKTVNVLTKEGVTSAQFDENKNLKVFGYISGMQGVSAKGIADFGEGGVGSGSGGTRYTLQKAEDTNKVTLQLVAEDGSGSSTQDINTFNATRAGLVPNASSTSHILFGDGWKQLEASNIPNLDWAKITTGKPTTLGGYGITDAYTKSQIANGIFPNMRVGLADDLGDIEETLDEEYTFQPTANTNEIRDGYAQIESLKGNSLVWNQKVVKITDSLTNQWGAASNLTVTIENGVITTYCKTQENGKGFIDLNLKSQGFSRIGHKYAILVDAKSDIANTRVLACVMGSTSTYYNVNSTNWERAICFGEHLDDNAYCLFRMYNNTTGNTVLFRNPQLIDLTQMFDEGNEPETVEEFERRCPKGMSMDYNEGEVIHFNGDIKSVGFNQWDEEWEKGQIDANNGENVTGVQIRTKGYIPIVKDTDYYLTTSSCFIRCYDMNKNYIGVYTGQNAETGYTQSKIIAKEGLQKGTSYIRIWWSSNYGTTYNNDICINISDPDKNGTYEPYTEFRRDLPTELFEGGMKSAGTAHDEIYWDKSKGKYIKVTRIGEVDLGSLDWIYRAGNNPNPYFVAFMAGGLTALGALVMPNMIVSKKYNVVFSGYASTQRDDKSITWVNDASCVMLYDYEYTDVNSLKASLQGVMLYYELEEPIIEEVDIPYMDYQVSNSGTEEIVSEVPTTPIKARVVYNFDTIGTVKQNRFDVSILKSSISNLSKGIGVSGNWALDGLKIGTYDVLHKGNTSLVIDSGDNFGFTLKVADSQIQMSDITEDELRQMINTAWGTNYEA